MSAGKKLAAYVTVADESGAYHTFGPDSDVPGWARKAISNPKAWQGGDAAAASADADDDGGDDGPEYGGMKVADLEAEIESRNAGRDEDDQIVPEGTKKADLIAALKADDAAE